MVILVIVILTAITVLVVLFFIPWIDRRETRERDWHQHRWNQFMHGDRPESEANQKHNGQHDDSR